MKRTLLLIRSMLLMLLVLGSINSFAVQLSGSYTIDPAAPASGTNFQDFHSAAVYLNTSGVRPDGGPSNAAPFGVSGAVTFSVSAGTYTFTQALIIDSIGGASPVNTITFTGGTGNASTRIITGNIPSSAMVVLKGCKYVKFRDLTVTNLASNITCAGISIIGNTYNNNGTGCSVSNCRINLPNTGTTTSYGVSVTATALGVGGSNNWVDSVFVDSNIITGGYYGIYIYGNTAGSASTNRFNKTRGNKIVNAYAYGIYFYYNYNVIDILNNDISLIQASTASSYGIYAYYNQNQSTTVASQICNNKIRGASYSGIYSYYNSTNTTAPLKIYNNMVQMTGASTYTGIYAYASTSAAMDIIHNTVNCLGGGNYGLYYYGSSTGSTIKNNIFVTNALSYPAYFGSNPGNNVNYNIYYNMTGTALVYRNSTAYTTLNYKIVSAGGDSSFNILPSFGSLEDLHLKSACSSAKGVDLRAKVPYDIDGDLRPALPFIGCDEFQSIANDLSVEAIANLNVLDTTGLQDLVVRVRNTGSTTISSFNVSYELNNGSAVTIPYSGSPLNECDTVTVTFSGGNQMNMVNINKIKIYISSPNGIADGNSLNDTLSTSIGAPLSGTYQVGGATPDFNSLNDAVAILTNAGVSGPVVFNVNPGTYMGQFIINDTIPGASAINHIVFDGGNAATTIIEANAAEKPVVVLNQTKYITITNFTINNTAVVPSAGVAIIGNNVNDKGSVCSIKKCIINLSTPDGYVGYGIIVTGSPTGIGLASNRADSVIIDSNVINGGNGYGISVYGNGGSSSAFNRGHRIVHNVVNNSLLYGIYAYYNYNQMEVSYNTINMSVLTPATTTSYGLYFYYNQNTSGAASTLIIGNRIKDATGYGMYIYYTNAAASAPTKIYNNMIAGGFRTTGGNYGIYLYGSSTSNYSEVYHNSINMDNPASTIYAFYYYGIANGSVFKNNIFAITVPGGGTTYPAYFSTNPTGNVVNYNHYYNASGANALYRGSAISNTAYKTASAGGDSSYFEIPNWIPGVKDLHLSNACGTRGVDLSSVVPVDLNGVMRSTTPLTGCYEDTGIVNNIRIEKLITPVAPITTGTQDVIVLIKNIGNNTVNSFNVSYTLNGNTPVLQHYATPLAPCDTVTITFTGAEQITLGSVNDFAIYTDAPNGLTDGDQSDDSVVVSYYAPLTGNYTIGGPAADFPTFAAADTALGRAGISGPVHFTINPGTYTTPVVINGPISGVTDSIDITFDGVDTATTRIEVTAPGAAAFTLRNASYVTVKNMSITNLATTLCAGIANIGNPLDNSGTGFTLKHCAVNVPNTGTATSFGVIVTGNLNGTAEADQHTDSVTIDSNVVTGAYNGIVISTQSTANVNSNFNRGHQVNHNIVKNSYYYAIKMSYIGNPVDVMYNDIDMNPVNQYGYGIYLYYNQALTAPAGNSTRIIGNKVNAGYSALYNYYYTSNAAAPMKIHNNNFTCFGSGAYAGAYVYTGNAGGGVVEFYHNNVVMQGATASYGLYYYNNTGSLTDSKIKNNIFYTAGAATYSAYFSTNPTGNVVNYNLYYNASGGNLVYRGVAYGSANYKTASAGGDSSYNFNPAAEWINNTDMRLTTKCGFAGVDLTASVAIDIDGDVRTPGAVTIGSDEPVGFADNLAVDALLQPTVPATAGLQDIVVRVKNKGNNPISSFNVSYSHNGGTPHTMAYSGSPLNVCDTVSFVFTGSDQINLVNANYIDVYVTDPNGTTDGNPTDDTLKAILFIPLNGNYTIGGAGADFANFAEATTALKAGGVNGPVHFTVNPGTYNEQVIVSGPVNGISDTTRVVFDGVDASTRIVTSTTPNDAAFKVNQVSYVTVQNLTINNLAANIMATGLANIGSTIDNSGTGFTAKNCVINLPNTGTTNSYGILVTGNVLASSETDQHTDSVTIDSNVINGAYIGISISTGSSSTANPNYNRGHRFRYNTVNNSYYYGIRVQYIYNPVQIIGNNISLNPVNVNSYGLYIYYNQSFASADTTPTRIIGNKVYAGYSGMYNYYSSSHAAYPTQIYNNMFTAFGPGAYTAAYLYTGAPGGNVIEFYHNSVNLPGATSSYALYYYNSTGPLSGSSFKNNSFLSGNPTGYPAYFGTNPLGNLVNYNIYYNTAGGNLVYRGSAFNSSNYKTATAGGDSSFNTDPAFVSPTDLHTTNACLRGIDLTAIIPVDIDGNVRSTSPVIGAHESAGLANDIAVESISYPTPLVSGLQDLNVVVKNLSGNAVSSMNISYVLNGGAAVTYAWTGTLAGCDTVSYTFTGADQIDITQGINSLIVYVSSPNGTTDNKTSNDTLNSNLTTITHIPGTAFNGLGLTGLNTGTYVRVAHKASQLASAAFTAEAWVKLADVTSNQKLVAKSTASNGFVLGVQNGKLYPEIWTDVTGGTSIQMSAGDIQTNVWTHVAMTWESGVGLRAYVNGRLAGEVLSATAAVMTPTSADMLIGVNSWDYGHATSGQIDEVKLWNVALDSTELRRNMHRMLTGMEAGLMSYIQLNEGVASATISDPVSGAAGRVMGTPLVRSTIPAGGDSTMMQAQITSGYFVNGDVTVSITDAFDNASDLTITEIPLSPDANPSTTYSYKEKYWILQIFGTPGLYMADLTFQLPSGYLDPADVSLGLYRRRSNGSGATWVLAKQTFNITGTTAQFSGVDTFGQFTIASNGTSMLPVSLISFGGKRVNDIVKLNWETANEINSNRFEIERSYNGTAFEKIGEVKAAGSSKSRMGYAFDDRKADLNKNVYYRLKQVDHDGKYSYSPVVIITPGKVNNAPAVYPNPFSSALSVGFDGAEEGTATIRITDITGKEVLSFSKHVNKGEQALSVDGADKLNAGVYFLSVEMGGEKQITKLIKQ